MAAIRRRDQDHRPLQLARRRLWRLSLRAMFSTSCPDWPVIHARLRFAAPLVARSFGLSLEATN